MGRSKVIEGLAPIGSLSALPVGIDVDGDVTDGLAAPFAHFIDNPFSGTLGDDFRGLDPRDANGPLREANDALARSGREVTRTTVLDVDTTLEDGGVRNIPFIVKQANAVSMRSTFWIQEVEGDGPRLRMQYAQVVMLEFAERDDGLPGHVAWPHVSINTLEKIDA